MYERLGGWSNVPNSYVNDDGKPNFNNSDSENDDHARVLVRTERKLPRHFCANRQFDDELQQA